MAVQELLNAAQKLTLSDQVWLATQLMQTAIQNLQVSADTGLTPDDEKDPLIDLFAGSPDLATRSEEILRQEINSNAGFTWKES